MATDLRNMWNRRAAAWVEWARDPELDDDFWSFHLEAFLSLVPEPGRLTLDLAAGEGRVTRELQRRGHTVIGVDSSPALTRAAAEHSDGAPAAVGDATKLPLPNSCVDLVVAFMCLHDFDDLIAAGAEIKRVLREDGTLLIALLHPFVTGTMVESYSSDATYESVVSRSDKAMVYRGRHRPLGAYLSLLEELGFRLFTLREVADHRMVPPTVKFIHMAASMNEVTR